MLQNNKERIVKSQPASRPALGAPSLKEVSMLKNRIENLTKELADLQAQQPAISELDNEREFYNKRGIGHEFQILQILAASDHPMTLKQIVILAKENINFTQSISCISGILKRLIGLKFAEKPERGLYQITKRGKEIADSLLSQGNLPSDNAGSDVVDESTK